MPQQFVARLRETESVLPGNLLVRLTVPNSVTSAATPGQFVMLGSGQGYDPLLLRPYSIMRATQVGDDGVLDLLVFTGGRGAPRLATASAGEPFPVLGPLGNGFTLAERVRRALLIAVGHGIAPMINLAETALARGTEVTMLVGATTASALLPLSLLPEDAEIVIATADGSRGHHGAVIGLLAEYLTWADAIYAYAPEEVYAALRDLGRHSLSAPAQVAMERSMACGIGACLGCVVETTGGLKTVCRDGPVFPLEALRLA